MKVKQRKARTEICPTCKKPVPVDEYDSLVCPDCSNPRGTFGELELKFRCAEEHGQPLVLDSDDAVLPELRDLACNKFEHPEFELRTLNRLSDWLRREHKLSRQQVLVCRLDKIATLLRQSSDEKPPKQPTTTDNETDNGKNSENYLPPWNHAAAAIVKRINAAKKAGDRITQEQAIRDYVDDNPDCEYEPSYLERVLTAHAKAGQCWKAKRTKNRQSQKQ